MKMKYITIIWTGKYTEVRAIHPITVWDYDKDGQWYQVTR